VAVEVHSHSQVSKQVEKMDISAGFEMDVDDTPHGLRERRDSAVGLPERNRKLIKGEPSPDTLTLD
jgi:hypothetical protein